MSATRSTSNEGGLKAGTTKHAYDPGRLVR